MRVLAGLAAVALVVVAVFASVEGAMTLLVGWVPFLGRVVPAVTPDRPTAVVGLAAVLVFATGVHWAGRSWRGANPARRWTLRSTTSVVLGVVVVFAAGVAVIGIVHQTTWLATDDQPLHGEGLARRSYAREPLKEASLGIGGHIDSDDSHTLPPGGSFGANGEMLHSWETHILPYMWYDTRSIDRTRPWNDPVNQSKFQCVLPEFINPSFRTPPLQDADGYGLSHYAANSRVMAANTAVRLTDLTNGQANTILLGEVNAGFKPWGHPINWRDPVAGIGSSPRQFGGPAGAGGAQFLMADWSIRFVSAKTSPEVLRSLADPRPHGR